MAQERIAKRYAKALYEAAKEKGLVEDIQQDIEHFNSILENNKKLFELFIHQEVPYRTKEKVLHHLVENKFKNITTNLLLLLIKKRRIKILPSILKEYLNIKDEDNNIVRVEVETSIMLSDTEKAYLQEKLERILNKKLIINYQINKDIIGGVLIRIGNRIIDGSIKGNLQRLRKSLIQL